MKIVSGIRPTGRLHLGNYLGAIKQFKQNPNGTYFIADLHGDGDAVKMQDDLARFGVHAIIESEHSIGIFAIQHRITRHVGVGRLERMTQYKDKCETEQATLALLAYPVLMAADIFYFGGTHIPVGSDQLQHIEFARDVADILAHHGIHYPKPEAILSDAPRIMSLQDATRKMSKSMPDGCIFLDDSAEEIRSKIAKAKTAMTMHDDTPEMRNLKTIYAALGGASEHEKFKDFKEELAELIIDEIES